MSDNKRDSSWVLWALGLIFVALKLMGYIKWSWIWVLCPIWIPIAIVLIFGILIGFVKGIRDALKRDKENKWMDPHENEELLHKMWTGEKDDE